jgi:hypothetical protein
MLRAIGRRGLQSNKRSRKGDVPAGQRKTYIEAAVRETGITDRPAAASLAPEKADAQGNNSSLFAFATALFLAKGKITPPKSASDATAPIDARFVSQRRISMRSRLETAVVAGLLTAAVVMPDAAMARHHYVHRSSSHRCSGGNGAVGTVAGGVGGAVIGHAVAGGPVGTVAGGVGGALLGRHLDKQNVRHHNGCR